MIKPENDGLKVQILVEGCACRRRSENWSVPSLGLRLRLTLQLAKKLACNVTFELEIVVVLKDVGFMQ